MNYVANDDFNNDGWHFIWVKCHKIDAADSKLHSLDSICDFEGGAWRTAGRRTLRCCSLGFWLGMPVREPTCLNTTQEDTLGLCVQVDMWGLGSSCLSPQYNEVSVRKYNTKEIIELKHQPELGACPCMRVGGFKRNPTGFSSGEREQSRRQTLQNVLRATRQPSFCLRIFLTTRPRPQQSLKTLKSCDLNPWQALSLWSISTNSPSQWLS